jgi:hypothetical protein
MASEKNPSIYDDRGAIGSSEELDEYGVWVKSGPQDISGESPAEDFSADYSSDNEDADISLDLSRDFSLSVQDDLPDFTNFTGTEDASGDTLGGDGGISDFGGFSFESPENDNSGDNGGDFGTAGDEDAGGDDPFLGFDVPPDTESGETIDFDAFPEFETDAQDSVDAPAEAGEISFEEIGINDDEDLNFEDFTGSIPEDIPGENAFQESDDDFTISFEDSTGFPEIPEESPGNRETAEVFPSAAEPDTEKSAISTQLLLRIVDELSSIKSELSSLKKELTSVKGAVSREENDDQVPAGFFDESDDEKIALTGDEMDHILNTASFEEEEGNDAVEGAIVEEPEIQGEPETIPIEIDMDEFGPEPVITPYEEKKDLEDNLSEDISGLSGDLHFDADEPASDTLPPDLSDDSGADLSDLTGKLSVDTDALPRDDEIFSDGETGNVDLSLDLSPENGEEIAGAFDSLDFDSSTEDSFAQLIPEGFEDKPAELPLHTEDTLEEDDLLETGILPEDDSLSTELFTEDISVDDISIEDISAAAGTGDSTGLDFGFELGPELDEDTPAADIEIPELSLDLGAEFDTGALTAAEDMAIDIPADGENAGEEPIEFDFTEESLESSDAAAAEDTEYLLDDISLGETDTITEEVLPDITLEDEPALELPVEIEDEALSADLGDFTVEAEEVLNEESFNEETLEEVLNEETLNMEIPVESETELPASPLPAAETNIPSGGALAKVPVKIREELKTVLTYMDQLLESLPEEKIKEFAQSEYFDTYKKLFEDLGLV